MSNRKLTTFFGSYNLGKMKRRTGFTILDVLDFSDIDVDKLIAMVMTGNKDTNYEKAADILDAYIAENEDHNIMTAYIDLIKEFDRDQKLFKSYGVSVDDLEKKLKTDIDKNKLANLNKEDTQE